MASLTQWTWVWVNSRRYWRTGKPGVLQSKGSPRLGHAWATEQHQQVIKATKENRGGYDAREWQVERKSPQAVRRWATWGPGRVSEAATASTRALNWVPAENVLGTVVLIFSRLECSWGHFLSMQACYIERMPPSRGWLVSLISEQVGLVSDASTCSSEPYPIWYVSG